jgi:hypothetical protein
MAKELGDRRIAANVIALGAINADFCGSAVWDDPDLNRMLAGLTAMGRTAPR